MPMEIQQIDNQLSNYSDDRITAEILIYKDQVGYGMIELGKRLIEMKKRLGHGKWLPYLKDEVSFTDRTAEKFMRIAEDCSNPKLISNLGVTKVYAILDVPSEDRETFINTPHQVETKNGIVEKTVEQMTVREVEQVIKLQKEVEEKDAEIQRLKQDNVNFNTRIGHERESRIFAQNLLEKKELELKQANKQKPEIITKTEIIYEESPELQKALWEAEQKANELNERLAEAETELTGLQYIKEKEIDKNRLEDEIEGLKEEQNKYSRNLQSLGKVYDFITRTKSFIKEEMLHIPTLTLPPNNNSETFLNDIALICDTLDNFSFAIKNQFINKNRKMV